MQRSLRGRALNFFPEVEQAAPGQVELRLGNGLSFILSFNDPNFNLDVPNRTNLSVLATQILILVV